MIFPYEWKRQFSYWLEDFLPPLTVGCLLAGAVYFLLYTGVSA